MDDETYRDVLTRVTGKSSCKDMGLDDLKRVIMDLKRLGFVPKQTENSTKDHGKKPHTAQSKDALMGKIGAILADLGLHWNYAHGMAKNMFGVEFVNWLSEENLYKLTQALAIHQARLAKKQ